MAQRAQSGGELTQDQLDAILRRLGGGDKAELDMPIRRVVDAFDAQGVDAEARMLICNNKHYCLVVKSADEVVAPT